MSDLAAVRRTVADTRSRSCVSHAAYHAIPSAAAAEALAANYPVVGAILGHLSFADLAAEFGVTDGTISMIVRGERWKRAGGPIEGKNSHYRRAA